MHSEEQESADKIATCCLDFYQRLPARGAKPAIRSDGRWEWTILAGVVLRLAPLEGRDEPRFIPIALATGVKALPYDDLSPHGDVLHDCHAEVLARRIARTWLLRRLVEEVSLKNNGNDDANSDTIPQLFEEESPSQESSSPRWRLRTNVASLHLYCSTLPCGDLSNALVLQRRQAIDHQQGEDSNACSSPPITPAGPLRGRSTLSKTGVSLRTKPGRPDSLPSIAMSCTDKLCLWTQCGFQGSLLSRWLEPIHFTSFVISDEALRLGREGEWTQLDRDEASANCGVILREKMQGTGTTPPFLFTSKHFPHSRESVEVDLAKANPAAKTRGIASDELDLVPASGSIAYLAGSPRHENLIEGRKQGASSKRRAGEALRASTRSRFCKLDWYNANLDAFEVLKLLRKDSNKYDDIPSTYLAAKHDAGSHDIAAYRQAKASLRGYGVDDALAQEFVDGFLAQHRISASKNEDQSEGKEGEETKEYWPPFYGWLVSGSNFERFDQQGKSEITK